MRQRETTTTMPGLPWEERAEVPAWPRLIGRIVAERPVLGTLPYCRPPEAVVTSLTLQPMLGLKYGVKYTLALGAGITDLDPEPKGLKPESSSFTTFGPQALIEPGSGATFGSAGIFVLGLRAYLVENFFSAGVLRVFDVTDPVAPVEIESARSLGMIGRPVDVAGEQGTVVVAMGPHARSLPSSLYVYDVSDPNPDLLT